MREVLGYLFACIRWIGYTGKPLKQHGRTQEYSLTSTVYADTSLGRNERMKTGTEVDLGFLPSGGDEGVWEWE